MVTDGIEQRLFNFSTVEIRLRKDEVLAKVKTINDWEEVNDIGHAVNSTKHTYNDVQSEIRSEAIQLVF